MSLRFRIHGCKGKKYFFNGSHSYRKIRLDLMICSHQPQGHFPRNGVDSHWFKFEKELLFCRTKAFTESQNSHRSERQHFHDSRIHVAPAEIKTGQERKIVDGRTRPWADEDGIIYIGVIPLLLEDNREL